MPGSLKRQLLLFFIAVCVLGVAHGIHESIFNNFLDDTFHLSETARGMLEFPRELPGLLVMLMAGVLYMLSVTRLGALGAGIFSLGLFAMGTWGGSWGLMVGFMIMASMGMHLLQPVQSSLAIALSDPEKSGRRLGQVRAVTTAGTILGAFLVKLLVDPKQPSYRLAFWVAALAALIAMFLYGFMHIAHLQKPRSRLVFRRKFTLYYILEFLFGARKQIFITFGPWVLIRIYGQSASDLANLFMIAAFIGLFFKPLVGMAVDHFGERTILVVDGIALLFVCIGYGYAGMIFPHPGIALLVVKGCFISDNLLFSMGTGRAVYLSRIADSHQELTSTLATGISINHIASMIIPAIAGAAWALFGFEHVFLAAAIFAGTISLVSSFVPGKGVLAARS